MASTAEAQRSNQNVERPPQSGVTSSKGAERADASGTFRTPDLRSVPPEAEDKKVVTELPAQEFENETAQWIKREHARQFGVEVPVTSAREKAEVQTLADLTEELGTLLAQRNKLEANIKRLDNPIYKTVEVLGKIGFLKDTVAAFAKWQEERTQFEGALASIDGLVRTTEAQIKEKVTTRETAMRAQSSEVAKGSPEPERQLIENWFYNRSTEGGAVSEEARQEWEEMERRAMDSQVIAGIKGFDEKDQHAINEWFQNPDTFVDEVDAELEVMAKGGELTPEEHLAWKKNELPPHTRAAVEERLRALTTEKEALEAQRDALEKKMHKAIGTGKDSPALWKERVHFDEGLRRKYLGGVVQRLFRKAGSPEDTFLAGEPEVRRIEAQLAIIKEETRRGWLVLKNLRQAVAEGAVRDMAGVVALRRRTEAPGQERKEAA